MNKVIIFFLFVMFSNSFGQNADSTLNNWTHSLVSGINISQVAFSNWTKGGENSITWTLTGTYNLVYKTESWNFTNHLKAAYGRTKPGGDSYRTNDNEFFLESIVSHNAGWKVDPYFSNSVRTAITTGYDYKTDPAKEIVDFFDPGYITQSIGFTYDKVKQFQTRLGFAFQEVFTNNYPQYTDDSTTADVESFEFETGIESVTNTEFELGENLTYKNKLRLFTRFESLDTWDIRWDNMITAKVNSWLNVNFAFLLVYEEAQSKQAQIKEGLQVGMVYSIF